jgi:hypothetical protein
VEENLKAQNFIKEVETIQTHREEDDMILDEITFDLSEKAVQEYPSFSKPTHEYCVQLAKNQCTNLCMSQCKPRPPPPPPRAKVGVNRGLVGV